MSLSIFWTLHSLALHPKSLCHSSTTSNTAAMKTTFLLACVVPLAVATRNAADIKYALPKGLSAESSACEFPGSYTIQNLVAVGNVANNFTNVTEVFFGFTDSETGLTSSCEMNSTSTNLAPGGAYAQYDCDDSNLKFSWGSTTTTGMSYKLAITEVICK